MMDVGASQQLEQMRGVAFRLGMAFGQEAERASDIDRKLKLFEAFHQCFASVRLAIALDLRLKKPAPQPAAERETERPEAPDWNEHPERPERLDALRYTERDRDRETERASFPLLLRKLTRIADDAEQLLPAPPAELPTLRELLAKVQAQPPADAPLRSRLNGSTTALRARPSGTPFRRSTGPP